MSEYCYRDDELLKYKEWIVLSDSTEIKIKVLKKLHNAFLMKYYEMWKMKNLIRWYYLFKEMNQFIINYVTTYNVCDCSKTAWKTSKEKLKLLLISEEFWTSLLMNFIIKLLRSQENTSSLWLYHDDSRLTN